MLKRIFLLGNLVAAALSVTPGLLIYIDVTNPPNGIELADTSRPGILMIIVGFLLLVAREVKFDEFDVTGDRIGGRLTLPMVFGSRALNVLYALLSGFAVCVLFVTMLIYGAHSGVTNFLVATTIAFLSAALLTIAYRSSSKRLFYKSTRILMLLLPVCMLTGL